MALIVSRQLLDTLQKMIMEYLLLLNKLGQSGSKFLHYYPNMQVSKVQEIIQTNIYQK